jgi:hypothetical protein
MPSAVALLRTRPETVVDDYGRLMRLVKYHEILPRDQDLILKPNLSWTKYFPACSSQPWQVDGILTTLSDDGYDRRRIFPVENKTVVTNPIAGCRNNKWRPVLERHGVPFIPLPTSSGRSTSSVAAAQAERDFPEGIRIPRCTSGKTSPLPSSKAWALHDHRRDQECVRRPAQGSPPRAHEYIHG